MKYDYLLINFALSRAVAILLSKDCFKLTNLLNKNETTIILLSANTDPTKHVT